MEQINVLLIEDDPKDAEWLRGMLSRASGGQTFEVEWTTRLQVGLDHLVRSEVDLVLLDLSLPDSQGIETLFKTHAQAPGVPIIVVLGGSEDEMVAVEAIQEGAQDYLVKGQVSRNLLVRAIRYAIERKQAQQEIADNLVQIERAKREWETTADSLPQIVCLLDEHRRVLRGNRALEKWGLAQVVNVKGQEVHELFHPGCTDPGCYLSNFWRRAWEELEQGRVYECEAEDEILKRYLLFQVQPILTPKDKANKSAASFAALIVQDITRRKEAETELRHARQDWEDIFQAIGQPATLLDSQFRILTANRATLSALGKPKEEVVGKKCHELFHRTGSPPPGCPLRKILTEGHEERVEVTEDALGGKYIVSCTPLFDAEGNLDRIIHIATDVTARVQAEEEVRRLNEGLEQRVTERTAELTQVNELLRREIAERERAEEELKRRVNQLTSLNRASQVITAFLEPDKVLEKIVSLAREMTGADYASVVMMGDDGSPRRITEISPDIPSVEHPIRANGYTRWIADSRQPVVVDEIAEDGTIISPPGHKAPPTINPYMVMAGVRSFAGLPLVVNDRLLGVIYLHSLHPGNFHDQLSVLTTFANQAAIAVENARLYEEERKQFHRLRQSQAQLIQAEKMTALGRLTATIAHEINNPLQSLHGALSLLEEELAGQKRSGKLDRYLVIIGGEIERITNLVRRMRDFYRPARQEQIPTDLHALLDSVLELVGKQLQHGNVTVEREWAAELPIIQANPDHLKQVFLNLVLNAIDAMPTGGTLRLHTSLEQMQANGDRLEPAVLVALSDTGEGIPPEVLSRLFEPFLTTKEHGSGLGLFISYEIVKAHNGQIGVESQVGAGTTFTILLPVGQP